MSLLLRQVPPARGSPTCLPRATLHNRLWEVTAQVAAHWSDLDKDLLVSAATEVPMGILLDSVFCCPREEEVCDVLVPVAHQVIPQPCCSICPLLSKHVTFERSVTRLLGHRHSGKTACRGKHVSYCLAIVSLEPWTTRLRSTFTTNNNHKNLRPPPPRLWRPPLETLLCATCKD